MTTVACVWVKGNVPYGVEYVDRLRAMVTRYLARPFQFVCLTDRPTMVPDGVQAIRVPNLHPLAGWWSKLECFNSAHGMTGRVFYLDLDTLIVGALDPIVDFPSRFALVPPGGTFTGRNRLAVVRRFNSSAMVFNGGEQARLFDDWSPNVARRLHGDQDFIGEQSPDADVMPLPWFPRISELTRTGEFILTEAAKVVLVKKPKCEEAARRWPVFREAWVA